MSRIAEVLIYPIKGFSGTRVSSVTLNAYGNLGLDRHWRLVSNQEKEEVINGKWAARNAVGRFWQLDTVFDFEAELLVLNDRTSNETVSLPMNDAEAIAAWFSDALRLKLELQGTRGAANQDDEQRVFSLISRTSAEAIGSWFGLDADEVILRLRPNLVLDGCDAFEEYSLLGEEFRLGNKVFQIDAIVPRCSVPACNPFDGARIKGFEKDFAARMQPILESLVPVEWSESFKHGYYACVAAGLASVDLEAENHVVSVGDSLICK